MLMRRDHQARRAGPASSSTATPSACAFSSFDPASLPATTQSVFFDTDPATLPPSDSIISLASSRVSVGSVPVRTNVLPANAFGAASASPSLSGQSEAGGEQAVDHLLVVRLGEEAVDALGDDRSDVGNGEQLRDVGAAQPLEAAEVAREVLRGRLADVADPEAVEEARERRRAARGDVGDEVACALVGHALERLELLLGERVEIGKRLHEPLVDELVDDLLAEAFDVERAPAGEMEDRELALRGAEEAAAAAVVDAALLAHDAAAAHRARRGHAEIGDVARALLRHPADDLGDDVAGAPDDDLVADAHAFPAHLEQVVQRRVRHRRSADEHRLELGDRRELAGAADLDLDRDETRRLLLRRVLLRDRPARLARLEAEPLLQRAVVDLVDDAVDVVGQRVALGRDFFMEANQPGGAVHAPVHRARRQAHRVERVEDRGLRRRNGPARHFAQAVGEEAERAPGGIARVELADDAGGGVARVDEDLLVLRAGLDELLLALVERGEVVAPHEDLAAHLDDGRRGALQPLRHRGDRAHGVRHVLARLAVAARRRLDERAVLVAQADGEAVELQLGVVGDRRVVVGEAERLADARVELLRAGGAGVGLGLDREHRHRVAHRSQAFEHRADDALRRRIGADELGVRRLDRLQLLEQRVVVGVGDLGLIEHVVRVRVMREQVAQLGRARGGIACGLAFRRRRGHASPRPRGPHDSRSRSGRTRAARSRRCPALPRPRAAVRSPPLRAETRERSHRRPRG